MNSLFIARQPIFDTRMRLFGYELLYRQSENNFFQGTDDDRATAALIDNSFLFGLSDLIDNTRAFINFSGQLLINETPFMLPTSNTVIEILERVTIDDQLIEACKKLKDAGYTLALDDFVISEEKANSALIELADIIKIEYPFYPLDQQQRLIDTYSPRVTFLAERLELAEEYKNAANMGYKLFQGFFFSRPVMVNTNDIGSLDVNLTCIMKELLMREPDFKAIADSFERDLGLSYKLLRMANSVHYGVQYPLHSIQQALARVGTQALVRWTNLMLLKGLQNADNVELVKTCLIRGKVLSLLALRAGQHQRESDYFMTGIFSSIHTLLCEDMCSIMARLPLPADIKDALLGKDNALYRALGAMLDFEKAQWDGMDQLLFELRISRAEFMTLYLEAIKWQSTLAAA